MIPVATTAYNDISHTFYATSGPANNMWLTVPVLTPERSTSVTIIELEKGISMASYSKNNSVVGVMTTCPSPWLVDLQKFQLFACLITYYLLYILPLK